MNVVMRPLTSIKASFQLINPLLTPTQWTLDSHWSWNNDDANDSFPVCGSTYREVPPFTRIERAWDREVICIRTDGTQSQVWRFAHHRSTAANGFWSTPRGNVSQDGKFYMFTSDWENTLGFLNGSRTQHRTDVFVVERERPTAPAGEPQDSSRQECRVQLVGACRHGRRRFLSGSLHPA